MNDESGGRDARGRFRPGIGGNTATRFPKGVSGNPQGVSRLRKQFEEQFFASMTDETTVSEATTALRKAIRAGEPWSIQLYFSRLLPPAPVQVDMMHGFEETQSDATLELIIGRIDSIASRGRSGRSLAEPEHTAIEGAAVHLEVLGAPKSD